MLQKNKIFCVRIDHIGDLALTLPVDNLLSPYDVTWLVNKGLGFICDYANPRRHHFTFERKFSFRRYLDLQRFFRREKPSHIIFFHAPWWMSCAAWMAGIPFRAGRKSQWHSFLFLNRGIRQSRLLGEKSELIYNYELMKQSLDLFGIKPSNSIEYLRLRSGSESLLSQFDLQPKTYIVVHAGMGGSARNWPAIQYASLLFRISKKVRVVMTGTRADAPWLSPIRKELRKYGFQENILWLDGKLSSEELLTVLNYAQMVVAPSTGIVHLAAALGVPTVGIYSPVKSQNVTRWGPKGLHVETLTPQVECPGIKKCIGPTCPKYDCMELITVDTIIQKYESL